MVAFTKTFRDPIHGDIDLYPWEVNIVDTPEFQRLRGIKQLGLADYVYPGAVHTRFEHSIGTVHVAQKMIDALKQRGRTNQVDEKYFDVIRLTALLHDIGHLPFGHTLEEECNILDTRHDQWQRLKNYIGPGTEIGAILSQKKCFEQVVAALKLLANEKTEEPIPPYIADLVGNTICADLLDYLSRDGYYCGINLGYDDRIIKYFYIDAQTQHLVVRLEKDGEFRRDNVSELVELLKNRYSLAEKVLFHHTKLAATAMLARAIQLSGTKERDILHVREQELLTALTHNENTAVSNLAKAVQERQLHKLTFRVSPEYAGLRQNREKVAKMLHDDRQMRENIAARLEKRFGMPAGSLCIYCPYREMLFKPAQVLVIPNTISPAQALNQLDDPIFGEEVRSLQMKHQGLWTMELFLSLDQYPKAVDVAEAFKRIMWENGILLENDLDARPSRRWQEVRLRNRVIEQFALDKDLRQSEREHLQLELENYLVTATRTFDLKTLESQYLEACSSWWRQLTGK